MFGALIRSLDPSRWSVTATDLAVEIGEDIRYPDVMVEAQDQPGGERSSRTPVLLVEVLSPSSLALDLHVKAAEYLSLPSLEYYIVAAQDETRVWIWRRSSGEARAFPAEPAELDTIDAERDLGRLGASLALAGIYRFLPRQSH